MKSRADIDTELGRLAERLPKLVDTCEPDELLEAFAAEAARITEHGASAEDVHYVRHQITCLLAAAGLIPADTEDEPCIPAS